MAYNHVSSISIMALILFLAGSPVSTGQIMPNVGISYVGRICCTDTGNCLRNSVGIPGLTVSLNCTIRDRVTRTPVILGTNVTNANGVFNITVSAANSRGVTLNQAIVPCLGTFQVPVNSTLCNSLLARLPPGFVISLVKPDNRTRPTETEAFGRVRTARILTWIFVRLVPQLF